VPLQRRQTSSRAKRSPRTSIKFKGNHDEPPNTGQAREQAVRDWERETDNAAGLGRQFSGERLKRVVNGDWLTKIGFVVGTRAVLYFILSHDAKSRRRKERGRGGGPGREPSVRDFRPPVMPARLASALPARIFRRTGANRRETTIPRLWPDAGRTISSKRRERIQHHRQGHAASAPSVSAATRRPPLPASAGIAGSALASLLGALERRPGRPNRQFADKMSDEPCPCGPKRVAGLDCVALQGKMIDAQLETASIPICRGRSGAIVSRPALRREQGRDALVAPGSASERRVQTPPSQRASPGICDSGTGDPLRRTEITLDSGVTDALGARDWRRPTLPPESRKWWFFPRPTTQHHRCRAVPYGSPPPEAQFNSADGYRREVQQSFARTSDRGAGALRQPSPTTTVRQGERIKVS